ncbi:acetate--CoA ligase family protein [bacterium]|nr:acetate--CoA ligase family protein [candidate division CSSED10-310 bacterium]
MKIDGKACDRILSKAFDQGRTFLMEHETYQLLAAAGLRTDCWWKVAGSGDDVTDDFLDGLTAKQVVLKIVSPLITHKTDVGGVVFEPARPSGIRIAIRSMIDSVPERYLEWIRTNNLSLPDHISGSDDSKLVEQIRREILGILVVEFIESDAGGFGYEMLAGMQWTREFGPVITMGLGGIDTELLAASLKPGRSTVTASASLSPSGFLEIFKQTIIYQKVAGLTRGTDRIADDEILTECYRVFSCLADWYGPDGTGEFVIDELEVNPFVFTGGRIVPLDGLCRFKHRTPKPLPSPVHKIGKLLHPKSMAVIGVSARKMNMGRIILRNILRNQFPVDHMYIIRPEMDRIDEVPCVPSIGDLPETVDVLVLAVDAAQTPSIIRDAAESGKVESVIIIPGGLGEKSGTEEIVRGMNEAIQQSRTRPDHGPIFVGGNCLGILSRPGRYDTLFVPEAKLPKNYDKSPDPVAFLSQSGARMITVMSQQTNLSPLFAVSTGNQMDLGVADFLEYLLEHEPDVKVVAVYVEGFRDLGGMKVFHAVRRLVSENRTVVFYKAGRTAAGRTATSGHTASIAGDYQVAAQLMAQAGAMVCDNFTEFNELIRLAVALFDKRVEGNRIAGISNAGYETVGMADNIGPESGLELAVYSEQTRETIRKILVNGRIETLVDIRNPMDVTPMAVDAVHEGIIQAQLNDPGIHAVIAATIPITPAQQTLPAGIFGEENILKPDSYPNRIIRLIRESGKPVISVIDSGEVYDPMVKMMERSGVVVFRTADLAIRMLGKYITCRLNAR